jgi:hypothetical protein
MSLEKLEDSIIKAKKGKRGKKMLCIEAGVECDGHKETIERDTKQN